MAETITRSADKKGRITLPKDFAGHLVIVERVDDSEVRIKKAAAIPEKELWLWRNPVAAGMVLEGLADAKAKNFVAGPDIAADAKLFADGDENNSGGE